MDSHTERLLVVSSYPARGQTHGVGTVGVASYTKKTLQSIRSKLPNIDILVLAERLSEGESLDYEDHPGIRVKRLWNRNSLLNYFKLSREIFREKSIRSVLVEFELNMFGGALNVLLFPFFLFVMRLSNKHVVIVLHQVITDTEEIEQQLLTAFPTWIVSSAIVLRLLNVGFKIFYWLVVLLGDRVIVFEEVLKKRLMGWSNRKVVVIPHAVESFENVPSHHKALQKLDVEGEFIVLTFGFLAWYKGTDWLARVFSEYAVELDKQHSRLVIAGGPNPNHVDKPGYRAYLALIDRLVEQSNGLIVSTGFIDEQEIPLYYSAADLVVFPYRKLISSSGPLSLAFAFEKPFLISTNLKEILDTTDMRESLEKNDLLLQDISFDLDPRRFLSILDKLRTNKESLDSMANLSRSMRDRRSWDKISEKYASVLSYSS